MSIGLFARSVAECRALQLRARGRLDEDMILLLCNLDRIATQGGEDFAHHHGLARGRLDELISEISRLSRSPAAAFGETVAAAIPELLFERIEGEWSVCPVQHSVPQLTLRHEAFAAALREATDADSRSALRSKWREACALHQAACLRDTTIAAVGNQLLVLQKTGLDSHFARLAPLTQRELATRLSLPESTISRVVRNRCALINSKIVPLARFFERPLAARHHDPMTRSFVLDALREAIATDSGSAHLSYLALSRKLANSGIEISRRRLGKYRDLLGLPSSRRRHLRAS